MAQYRVSQNFVYSMVTIVEADSLAEAKEEIENNPDDYEWWRTDEGEDYHESDTWEVLADEDDEDSWEEVDEEN